MPSIQIYVPEEMDEWLRSKLTKNKSKVDVIFELLSHVKYIEDEARKTEFNKDGESDNAGL